MFYARGAKILGGKIAQDATNIDAQLSHYFQLNDTIEKQSRSGKATANAAIT
jgi:sporulation-control protein spo0M